MSDFELFRQLVGTDRILKLLQDVGKEAIDAGDWFKVRQIADLVEQITGYSVEMEADSENPQIPLTTLNISTRCLELLKKAGINTVSDLQRYSLEGLLEINGIGEVAAKQIDSALAEKGITLQSFELRSYWQQETSSPSFDLSVSSEDEYLPDMPLNEEGSLTKEG